MMTHELGLFDGIDDTTYRSAPGLSASEAKILLGKRPPAPSPALAFGTLVHTLVLEPNQADRYTALDAVKIGVKADGTQAQNPTMTTAWKNAVAEAEADGLTIVAQEDWDTARRMTDAVYAHKAARWILDACTRREVSGWATHDTGALVKGRLDLLGSGLVADLKTTQNADPDAFGKTCLDYGYYVSGANYLDIANAGGESVDAFVLINVEKIPTPGNEFRVSVTELASRAIDFGRQQMAEAAHRWLDLGRVDLPAYSEHREWIDLPEWVYPEAEIRI